LSYIYIILQQRFKKWKTKIGTEDYNTIYIKSH
jgi:hypothetical protein